MYFATVSLSTACPSFASSFAMRRRLHSGLSRAICSMSRTISAARGGRPTRRDFQVQNRAKPRRCHAVTVSGRTIASTSAQRDHVRDSRIQNARSIGRSRGRGLARRSDASCWRSARFSATRDARGCNADSSARRSASMMANIGDYARAAGRRCHRRIATGNAVAWPRGHVRIPLEMRFSSPQDQRKRTPGNEACTLPGLSVPVGKVGCLSSGRKRK